MTAHGREQYLGQCRAALWETEEIIGEDRTALARHLLDHEPAEAMLFLATAIAERGEPFPRALLQRIRSLGDRLVPDDA